MVCVALAKLRTDWSLAVQVAHLKFLRSAIAAAGATPVRPNK